MSIQRPNPRNLPCPCNSGRKYKQCCMEGAVQTKAADEKLTAHMKACREYTGYKPPTKEQLAAMNIRPLTKEQYEELEA